MKTFIQLTEATAFEMMQDIVKNKSAKKIEGTLVDMFTASVVVKAYKLVNDANKKKIEKSKLNSLVAIAQKIMGMKEEDLKEDAELLSIVRESKG